MTSRAWPAARDRQDDAGAPPPALVPFSVFDELGCYHDHPAEPNNVHLEMKLSGHLDEAALRAATATAVAAEPRLHARRVTGRRLARRFWWEFPSRLDHDPVSVTSWRDDRDLARVRVAFLAKAPPLDAAPPVRLLLATGPEQDYLILNAHHAAVDGLSCLELLRGIARHYQAGQGEPGRPGPVGQAQRVTAAGSSGPDVAPGTGAAGGRPDGFRLRPVTRIAADRGPQRHEQKSGYGYHLLPVIEAEVLQAGRSRFLATVNDLLICALIMAVVDWNAAHGRSARRIQITMPVGARPPGQAAAIGNLSALAVVTAPWPESDGAVDRLVGQVARQTETAKQASHLTVDPLSRALTVAWLPTALKRALLRGLVRTVGRATIDTSLVTNLGVIAEPPQFGQIATTAMAFSTSAHLPRGLSVGAVTVGGQLQVCLRYRLALLDDGAATRFAQCYASALGVLLGDLATG